MTRSDRRRILLTGFGPFPGTPVNASALLVERLARRAAQRWPRHEIAAHVLATEWTAGPQRLNQLWDQFRPDVALHFGVSDRARGMEVETTARNHCRMDVDAGGAMPVGMVYRDQGVASCETCLPVEAILHRLAQLGVRAFASEDAGAYLCNAVFYESLGRAAAARPAALSGFIHVPTELGATAADGPSGSSAAQLTWDQAVEGGIAIIETTLKHLATVRVAEAARLHTAER